MFGLLKSEKMYCVFCKLPHRLYLQKDLYVSDILVLLVVSGLFATLVWGGPDLRSLLLFFSLMASLGFFLRVRWRGSVKCPHCGFDPVIYQSNPATAAQISKDFLHQRKGNPQFLLKPQPKIKAVTRKTENRRPPAPAKSEGPLQSAVKGTLTDHTI